MYDKVCNGCGSRLSDFYNTGMLGCEHCYKAFEKEIMVALKKIQGRTFHTGKIQRLSNLDKQLINEYNSLIEQRENATIKGDFKNIKELTEQIISLAEELKNRGLM